MTKPKHGWEGLAENLRKVEINPSSAYIRKHILDGAFDKQRDFILDTSEIKALLCGRGAGKTDVLARLALYTAYQYPGCTIPYLTVARSSAASQAFVGYLMAHFEKLSIQPQYNAKDTLFVLPNGSMIKCFGIYTTQDAEVLRGQRFPGVIFDETASIRNSVLTYVYDAIITPALMKYKGSWVVFAGTPGIALGGLFHRATTGKMSGCSVHSWDARSNPFLENDVEAFFKNVLKNNNWTEDHPTYQREYLGKWVELEGTLVYPFTPLLNSWDPKQFPLTDDKSKIHYVAGVDLGFVDKTAFLVGAWVEEENNFYVVHSEQKSGQIVSDVCRRAAELQKIYGIETFAVDAAGAGKLIVEEMSQQWGLPAEATEKRNKREMQELIRADLTTGKIRIDLTTKDPQTGIAVNQELIDDMSLMTWSDDTRMEEDRQANNHLLDALLYCWRISNHSKERKKKKEETYETFEEYIVACARKQKERALRKVRHERQARKIYR